jgi:hypothetical protein
MMKVLKTLSQSIHLVIIIVGLFPFFSIELNGCGPSEVQKHEQYRVDSLKLDSLVIADSVNLEIKYKKEMTSFNNDSFSIYYKHNKISQKILDNISHQDSANNIRNWTSQFKMSGYYFLVNTKIWDIEYKELKEELLGFIFWISIDLLLIISLVGIFYVILKRPNKFKHLRDISFICLILYLIIFLIWLLESDPCGLHIEYGFVLLGFLYLFTAIIDQLILKSEKK